MKLIRYNNNYSDPFISLENLFNDNLFGTDRYSCFAQPEEQRIENEVPVNIYEDEDNYYITAELPGVSKKDLKIELENAVLNISGEWSSKTVDNASPSSFSRSISVGENINRTKVKAKLLDGILTITLPRNEELKARSITVS